MKKINITQRDVIIVIYRIVEVLSLLKPIVILYLIQYFILLLNDFLPFFSWESEMVLIRLTEFIAAILFCYIFFGHKVKKNGYLTILQLLVEKKKAIFIGFSVALVCNALLYIMLTAPGISFFLAKYLGVVKNSISGTNAFFLLLTITIFGPAIEEYIYRKCLYANLRLKYDVKHTTLIVSILFAVLHYTNVIWSFLAFWFSVLLCKEYEKNGYVGSFAMHLGFNSVVFLNYFIDNLLQYFYYYDIILMIIHLVYLSIGLFLLCKMFKENRKLIEF